MELTIEQQRAQARARARLRLQQQQQPKQPTGPQSIGSYTEIDGAGYIDRPGQRMQIFEPDIHERRDDGSVWMRDQAEYRGEIVPASRDADGNISLALPGFLDRAKRASVDLMEGTRSPREITGQEVFDLGGAMTIAGNVRPRGAGAIPDASASSGPGIPGLRARSPRPSKAAQIPQAPVTQAVGAVANAATAPLRAVTRPVAKATAYATAPFRKGSQEAADDLLRTTVERTGRTPDELVAELDAGKQAANFRGNSAAIPETLADIGGDATQRLLEQTVIAPGKAGNLVRERLNARQAGQRSPYSTEAPPKEVGAQQAQMGQRARLLDDLSRSMELRTAESAYKTEKGLVAELKAAAQPAYAKAWDEAQPFDLAPVATKWLSEAADMEGTMLAQVRRTLGMFMDKKGNNYRPLGRPDELKRFDSAKRALDDRISTYQRQGKAELVRMLTQMKHDLLDAVHGGDRLAPTANVAYHEARDLFTGGKQLQNALQAGRQALNEGTEATAEQFAQLSTAEQKLFRLGLFDAVRQSLGRQKPTDDATQLFRRGNVAELLTAVMPRYKEGAKTKPADQFGELLSREQRMVSTRNMLSNSRTAFRMEGQDDFDVIGRFMERVRNSGMVGAVIDTATLQLQRMFGMREDTARILADLLTDPDPDVIKAALKRIQATVSPAEQPQANSRLMAIFDQMERAAGFGALHPGAPVVGVSAENDGRRE